MSAHQSNSCHLGTLQVQLASIKDLQAGRWQQLVFEVRAPTEPLLKGAGFPGHECRLISASDQVLDSDGRPIPNSHQQQYNDWVVPALDCWTKDGTLVGSTKLEI